MPARDRSPRASEELEDVEYQAGAARERTGQSRPQREEQQAGEHAGDGDGGERNGGEVEDDADGGDGAEGSAVIGAVASVAPIDEPSVRHQAFFPRAWSVQRVKLEAPQSAAADSQPPRSRTAQGSTSRTRGRWQRAARWAPLVAGARGSAPAGRPARPPGWRARASRGRRRRSG